MIVADTNVVSEFLRERPQQSVIEWATSLADEELAIAAMTVQEVEFGILRLPHGRRRDGLAAAWTRVLTSFDGQVLVFDETCARSTAGLLATAQRAGTPMPLVDAQIAGTCLVHSAILATRNTADFRSVPGLDVVNPFLAF